MKNKLRLALLLATLALINLFTSCGPKSTTEVPDHEKIEVTTDYNAVCDTLGQSELARFEVTDQQIKYKKLKEDWKRSKRYTLCIDAKLVQKDERVHVAIYEPGRKKVEVISFIIIPGKQQVFYIHRKSRFTPEISIKYFHNDGTEEYGEFVDTLDSACGAGLVVKDKLSSTSTQGSTVLVTIDEK